MDDEDAVHCVIWLGCTSKCCASSATVFWPLIAANATFALNAGVWFRRARLLIVSPDSSGTACPLSGRNSTYPPVQISGAGSGSAGPAAQRTGRRMTEEEKGQIDEERDLRDTDPAN